MDLAFTYRNKLNCIKRFNQSHMVVSVSTVRDGVSWVIHSVIFFSSHTIKPQSSTLNSSDHKHLSSLYSPKFKKGTVVMDFGAVSLNNVLLVWPVSVDS